MMAPAWLVGATACVGGCGLIGFAPAPSPTAPADAAGDAARAPSRCPSGEVDGPFGADFATTIPAWATTYDQPDGAIGIVSGALEITPSTIVVPPAYLGLWSPQGDLRGRRVFAEVSAMVSTSAPLEAGLWFSESDFTYAGVNQAEGQLGYHVVEAGADVTRQYVPYDPAQHRWWQIRELAGRTYFEASADGVTWIPLGDVATPAHVANASIEVAAGSYGPVTVAPGAVRFDQLGDCMPMP